LEWGRLAVFIEIELAEVGAIMISVREAFGKDEVFPS